AAWRPAQSGPRLDALGVPAEREEEEEEEEEEEAQRGRRRWRCGLTRRPGLTAGWRPGAGSRSPARGLAPSSAVCRWPGQWRLWSRTRLSQSSGICRETLVMPMVARLRSTAFVVTKGVAIQGRSMTQSLAMDGHLKCLVLPKVHMIGSLLVKSDVVNIFTI
ncbi:unnamed protein product, partial [Prorocentrum cordatum]